MARRRVWGLLCVVVVFYMLKERKRSRCAPTLHLVMAANKATPSLCRSLATVLLHDYQPVIINWGEDTGLPYRNKAAKLRGMYEYLKRNTTHPADIVIMVDGLDSWAQQSPDVLYARYLALAQGGVPIIMGADKNCFPEKAWCRGLPNSTIDRLAFGPDTDIGPTLENYRPKYVNSGHIIGYAKQLTSLYAAMTDWEDDPFGDQVVFAQFFQNSTYNIKLDYRGDLFFNLGYSEEDAALMPDYYGVGPLQHQFNFGNMVWNSVTGTMPVFVHFPGKMKQKLFEWWPVMWWGRLSDRELLARLQNRGILFAKTGELKWWSDLCKDLWREEEHFVPDLGKWSQQVAAGVAQ